MAGRGRDDPFAPSAAPLAGGGHGGLVGGKTWIALGAPRAVRAALR